jgi:SAM-dependent methyltransferase
MSRLQTAFCRSRPWRVVAGRGVLPWSLQGFEPHGDVLEIGAGSGAMAAALIAQHRDVTMTVTDFDPDMVRAASARLAPFGPAATVRQADATALPFPDAAFDVVVSWAMLHHTVEWESALREAVRVLRPGGHLVGYDLLAAPPLRLLHRGDGDRLRLMSIGELRTAVGGLPVEDVTLEPSLGRLVVRFLLRKSPGANPTF